MRHRKLETVANVGVLLVLQTLFSAVKCELFSEEDFFGHHFEESSNLDSFSGIAAASNYTYYSYDGEGAIIVRLISLTGDADLYVGEDGIEPTFDLDRHSLQSITCGEDIVEVPTHFKRPVNIGVYGHPSHESSLYVLQVTEGPANYDFPDQSSDSQNTADWDADQDLREEKVPPSKRRPPPAAAEYAEKSVVWDLLIGILGGLSRIAIEVLT